MLVTIWWQWAEITNTSSLAHLVMTSVCNLSLSCDTQWVIVYDISILDHNILSPAQVTRGCQTHPMVTGSLFFDIFCVSVCYLHLNANRETIWNIMNSKRWLISRFTSVWHQGRFGFDPLRTISNSDMTVCTDTS